MNITCEQAQERMAERWMSGASDPQLAAHLAQCETCRAESEGLTQLWNELGQLPLEEAGPSGNHRRMLEAYWLGAALHTQPARASKWNLSRSALQIGMAAALLILGALAGTSYANRSHDQQQIAVLTDELREMRQLVAVSMLHEDSAVERLRGVGYSREAGSDGVDVTAALFDALAHDANVNVRLAAMDALRQIAPRPEATRLLRQAVAGPQSPLVQIELVNWAVETRDKAALDTLQNVENLDPAVADTIAKARVRLQ